METGYIIFKCYFRLVKGVSVHMCYRIGGMLRLIRLRLCHRPQAPSLGGSSIGFSHSLQMAACWSQCFLWPAQYFLKCELVCQR